MEIGKTLAFLRKNDNKIQQDIIELIKNMKQSTYSRLEKDERDVSLDELEVILKSLSIPFEEFIYLADFDIKQREFTELFYKAVENKKDSINKKRILEFYRTYEKNDILSLEELSNFIVIKRNFYKVYKEVEMISRQEVSRISSYLISRKFYTYYDYSLLLNISPFLTELQCFNLFQSAYPIKQIEKRSEKTIRFALSAATSIISNRVQARDYENLEILFKDVDKLITVDDVNYTLEIDYLKNITKYGETGEPKFYKKMISYTEFLKTIKQNDKANEILREIKEMTLNRTEPIDPRKGKSASYVVK